MKEIDHLMTLDAGGLKEYDGALDCKAAQISEWLDTPEGSVYGLPSWGNILAKFKHDPLSEPNVQAAMESLILQKLAQDLPRIKINGIRVSHIEFDLVKVVLVIPEGEINEERAV